MKLRTAGRTPSRWGLPIAMMTRSRSRANAIKDDLDLEVWQGPCRVAVLKGESAK
jgi:hypothetical protein